MKPGAVPSRSSVTKMILDSGCRGSLADRHTYLDHHRLHTNGRKLSLTKPEWTPQTIASQQ